MHLVHRDDHLIMKLVVRALMGEATRLLLVEAMVVAATGEVQVVNCQGLAAQSCLLHLVLLVHLVHLVAPAVLVAMADGLGNLDHLQVRHVRSKSIDVYHD